MNFRPCRRANSRLNRAGRTVPRCSRPVGLGAKRTTGLAITATCGEGNWRGKRALSKVRSRSGIMRLQNLEYSADGARMVGEYAVDNARSGRRAGILVCHEGNGLTEHTRKIA